MNVFYYVLNFKKFLYVFDVFGRFKNFFSADFFYIYSVVQKVRPQTLGHNSVKS